MTVVLIVQHADEDGPCLIGDILSEKSVPFVICKIFEDDDFRWMPESQSMPVIVRSCNNSQWRNCLSPAFEKTENSWVATICGVIVLGGDSNVRDELPYFSKLSHMMLSCVASETPLLAICLGAQLLSHTLGGIVDRAVQPEYGWVAAKPCGPKMDDEAIYNWFGCTDEVCVFQWHADTFSIPSGAVRVAVGKYCENQAFQLPRKRVLATQFHWEIDGIKAHFYMSGDAHQTCPLKASCIMTEAALNLSLEHGSEQLQSNAQLARRILEQWLTS